MFTTTIQALWSTCIALPLASQCLLAALLILQVLDVQSTRAVLSLGGREANPLLAMGFLSIGIPKTLLIAKAVLLVCIAMTLTSPSWVWQILVAFYVGVILWNAHTLICMLAHSDPEGRTVPMRDLAKCLAKCLLTGKVY